MQNYIFLSTGNCKISDFSEIKVLIQEREHAELELDKLNCGKAFLKGNGVFDRIVFQIL